MDIEKEIQAKGLTAPRVTPADIKAVIASEHYFQASEGAEQREWNTQDNPNINTVKAKIPGSLHWLTFCVLVLKNGFTVTGESACASPENFDPKLGERIARENAVNKIWPLLGYELKSRLQNQAQQPPQDNAHVAPGCEQFDTTIITFDDFVQYGRDNGANIVNGMPWSFSYKGHPVTHENDNRYIIGTFPNQVDFTPYQVLVTGADGSLIVRPVG